MPYFCCNQVQALEKTFKAIQLQRMQGIPIVNPALQVEAINFQVWEKYCVGILITPWFMNLLVLPDSTEQLHYSPKSDEKITYHFPSGEYEFLVCYEESLGIYHSCSLFSPMFDFTTQEIAKQTAQQVLMLLMQPVELMEKKGISRRDLLRGKARE
ncbi:(NiFe) hydrogenase assembly chaperone, HybE family [Beggiatoa alba B18LD]|uniref:(NiFe) hydrogenase assembly chaperone, HybE family n=1 Tax=Beggiatoa alba B18LD TaxID=395493 RepID=I3CK92_9GAMM|nr:[NiFe]-hydrogenase assembly chaperone HybE [Beggiatoa alba]EIJ44035.1 (NiFe) hydrogenase assembly chaperone, HybE family [Beggiatoa alba B18LD]